MSAFYFPLKTVLKKALDIITSSMVL